MPTFYVSQEFVDVVKASGYDVQQYINALLTREILVVKKLKSTMSAEDLSALRDGKLTMKKL
jgi:hypothetical protein